MTLNFANTSGIIDLYGTIATTNTYWFKLKSRYSNKYLLLPEKQYHLLGTKTEHLTGGTSWYSFLYDISDVTNRNEDIGGYYDFEIWGGNTIETSTKLVSVLCKLINENSITETAYVSDNENNEQIVYYR